MKTYWLFIALVFTLACQTNSSTDNTTDVPTIATPELSLEQAEALAEFAFHCIDTEYPNKLGQVLGDASYLKSPQELHPMFYGCFDWHSAVHGHWSLVRLLKKYPNLSKAPAIRAKLDQHFTSENVQRELAYFDDVHNKNYERTYGWAWLLKLAEELNTWDDPQGQAWAEEFQPYADFIAEKYVEFLPKLNYPIRIGEHSNTAFGLTFAWDYANAMGHKELKDLIEQRAKDYYLSDTACPVSWEPGGFDFLSPCLEEADIMGRILPQDAYSSWLNDFLPDLESAFQPVDVTDRTDGKLVHLDGLNFSRAWCLYGIAQRSGDPAVKNLANEHLSYSLDKIKSGSYAGEHWLASFAIYALSETE
ncbi:MAG: DUF2891 domain-containing protein [Saprospiraceae bacterium]|nr:DUF2891 domain-containing protein [Saprospiraceae bacterium]